MDMEISVMPGTIEAQYPGAIGSRRQIGSREPGHHFDAMERPRQESLVPDTAAQCEMEIALNPGLELVPGEESSDRHREIDEHCRAAIEQVVILSGL
jgi:hypothetical protein